MSAMVGLMRSTGFDALKENSIKQFEKVRVKPNETAKNWEQQYAQRDSERFKELEENHAVGLQQTSAYQTPYL